MCGIVGYVGGRAPAEVLLKGLAHLEYRGYDSAGLAIGRKGTLQVWRSVGRLAALVERVDTNGTPGTYGIGHTRWATHGRPTEFNAHPHVDCKGRIAVVHNGIIENFDRLKADLKARGHRFRSQTDSEIIAHLLEECFTGDLEAALRITVGRLEGMYAVAAIAAEQPNTIVAARFGPPLALAAGSGEYCLASDAAPLLEFSQDILYLDNGELAVLDADGIRLTDLEGRRRDRKPVTILWVPEAIGRGTYPTFMRKEIDEQPEALAATIRPHVDLETRQLQMEEELVGVLQGVNRVHIVACGTAYHAGLTGRHFLERLAGIPVEVEVASEYRYRDPLVPPGTLAVAISQSGETADTLAAMQEARRKGARVLSICNVVGSMAAREADAVLYTQAGPEIGVASTKAFTTQMVALYLIAMALGQKRGMLSSAEVADHVRDLLALPNLARAALACAETTEELAQRYGRAENFLYLGRGVLAPLALEGALKLKEISYIHAEGYPAGEMKHGPIALIHDGLPVVILSPSSRTYEKMLSNLQEVKARGGRVLAIATSGDRRIINLADDIIWLPPAREFITAILAALPLQLLAYHIGRFRGADVDKPRNLAKSVTVE